MMNTVKVWDIFVRVFHWSLLILFVFSYFSGEEETDWHMWSGYAILILVVARIAWGFIGTRHARFSDFIFPFSESIAYAKGLLSGNPKRYIGHNPLGGLMVVVLLFSLMATTFSGMILYGVEEGEGPFSSLKSAQVEFSLPALIPVAYADDDYDEDSYRNRDEKEENEFLEEIHEFFVNFTLFLAFLHVVGVALESVIHKESLVRAMINGYKRK